jgi:hypothetical protein
MPGLDPETREMVLDTLKKYARDKLPPEYLIQLDHDDEFPEQVLRELCDPQHLGLHLVFIPEEYGGLGGSAYDIYRVSELMASIDLGIATGVLATFLGTDPITVGATPEQKKYWMTKGVMALPMAIGSVRAYRQLREASREPGGSKRLYARVTALDDGKAFDCGCASRFWVEHRAVRNRRNNYTKRACARWKLIRRRSNLP